MPWNKQPFGGGGDSSTDPADVGPAGGASGDAAAEAQTPARASGVEACDRCFACSRDKVALWRHVRDAHGDDMRLVCLAARCGRRFSTLFASAAHRSHHVTRGPVPYTCELCGRLSPDRSAFDMHVAAEHRDAGDSVCGACGRFQGDVESLAEHARAAHGVQTRTCETPSGGGRGAMRRRDV